MVKQDKPRAEKKIVCATVSAFVRTYVCRIMWVYLKIPHAVRDVSLGGVIRRYDPGYDSQTLI